MAIQISRTAQALTVLLRFSQIFIRPLLEVNVCLREIGRKSQTKSRLAIRSLLDLSFSRRIPLHTIAAHSEKLSVRFP